MSYYDVMTLRWLTFPASAEFVESDLKINTSSGRVVLRKQYSAQPSQFHSFR